MNVPLHIKKKKKKKENHTHAVQVHKLVTPLINLELH